MLRFTYYLPTKAREIWAMGDNRLVRIVCLVIIFNESTECLNMTQFNSNAHAYVFYEYLSFTD